MKKFLPPVLALFLLTACNSNDSGSGNSGTNNGGSGTGPAAPAVLTYSLVQTFPHDTSSFTEGLQIYKGGLFESTGNYGGASHLIEADLNTGKAIKKIPLGDKFFGEGITILRDTLYQMTYKEGKVFVYKYPDLRRIAEYPLTGTSTGEGWGMTTDGTSLIVTDGSSTLFYYDPNGFRLQRTMTVTEAGSLTYNLNEPEFIDGFIYANQWQQPFILKIDPGSGAIVGKIDVSDLWKQARATYPEADVPNGIAYDQETKKIYVTGKNWPQLFEVKFSQ